MPAEWVILHGGALGDLVLTVQLGLRLPGVLARGRLHLISRINPGDLSACRPSITRRSADAVGLHWLYGESDDADCPPALRNAICGARVLSALGDAGSRIHRRLQVLGPAAVLSFDPRPRADLLRHITQQWQSDLEARGLLIPKCVHQRSNTWSLGVPKSLRAAGSTILEKAGAAANGVLIHPGSGGQRKCWPLHCLREVGRLLAKQGVSVCFLIGPVEAERRSTAELAGLEQEFPLLRVPGPEALVATLAAARALIANDSGPAHLAALLGTRTVALFGTTSPAIWRPLGRDVCVIPGDPSEQPDNWGIDPGHVAALATRNE